MCDVPYRAAGPQGGLGFPRSSAAGCCIAALCALPVIPKGDPHPSNPSRCRLTSCPSHDDIPPVIYRDPPAFLRCLRGILRHSGRSEESSPAEEAAPPSVAKLAGLFGDKANSSRKEAPPHKPTRRKPPCSLPLPKPEAANNGDEKVSPPHTQMPKIKVKSSPLIEKLQANLAFAPASFLPGPSPKSPGLKVMASPFTSPPSTPSSPGVQSRASESEESPVSFEQPPEGAALASYTKVRTRGSLKRRPPSRRFRKSQSDMDFDIDTASAAPKENGDKASPTDETRPTCQADAASSHDPPEKPPESRQEKAGKSQEDAGKTQDAAGKTQEEAGKTQEAEAKNEEGSSSTAEEHGGHPDQEEAAPDAGVTDPPITREGAGDGGDTSSDGREEGGEPDKSDGDVSAIITNVSSFKGVPYSRGG
ncbi:capZ-interacting protein [Mantella aurantiaca]